MNLTSFYLGGEYDARAKEIFESDARIMLVVHSSSGVLFMWLRDGRQTSIDLKAACTNPIWTALGERGEIITIKNKTATD